MSRKTTKTGNVVLLCLLGLVLVCGSARADSYRKVDDASAEEIVAGMSGKAARGLVNVATGWLEFPRQIYLNYHDHGPVQGALVGPFMGIGMMVTRTAAGALELFTFYLAYPGFFDPYLEPRYVWDDIEE
jgi:putative exosortase-associated protein (TIGR04073 family)